MWLFRCFLQSAKALIAEISILCRRYVCTEKKNKEVTRVSYSIPCNYEYISAMHNFTIYRQRIHLQLLQIDLYIVYVARHKIYPLLTLTGYANYLFVVIQRTAGRAFQLASRLICSPASAES